MIHSMPEIIKDFDDGDAAKGIGTTLGSIGGLAAVVSPMCGPAAPFVLGFGAGFQY